MRNQRARVRLAHRQHGPDRRHRRERRPAAFVERLGRRLRNLQRMMQLSCLARPVHPLPRRHTQNWRWRRARPVALEDERKAAPGRLRRTWGCEQAQTNRETAKHFLLATLKVFQDPQSPQTLALKHRRIERPKGCVQVHCDHVSPRLVDKDAQFHKLRYRPHKQVVPVHMERRPVGAIPREKQQHRQPCFARKRVNRACPKHVDVGQ
mmetsp:Transcript_8373/g.21299  ORF Transcript_8373/g.21299 Transcript_8373/m.21299 type:complete len:208 (-) Transcript_8373:208-831(-)